MSDEQEEYISILKASYNYTPQSEDEIEIKEDQLLLLIEKVDDDWWKVKPKGETDNQGGLVPSAYVESAEHSSIVKAQYDYDATAQGELSLKEDQTLLVFGEEEDGWLLVQEKDGGKVGYVPGNYVETMNDAGTPAAAPPAASQIVIPDSPPRLAPPSSTYVDPAELVRSTASKAKADAIKTWAVSEIDKKGKKKKGTLGVGNGAIFFASEADKTPVRKWQITDITSAEIEKSKHVLIEVDGTAAASLHFHAGNKDTAEEILGKLESSRSLARASTEVTAPPAAEPRVEPGPPPDPEPEPAPAPAPIQRTLPPPLRTDGAHSPSRKEVHFSEASPAIIPPRAPSPPDQPQDEIEGLEAVALYDFQAQGDDELTVVEGDALWIIEEDGDEWWKCRKVDGSEGVVPASYVEPTGAGRLPPRIVEPEVEVDDTAERDAEEHAAAERAEQEARAARERKDKQEQEQRARATAAAAEADRKRKEKEKRNREEHEREERARREKEREEEEAEDEARRERRAARAAAKAGRSSKSTSEGRKSVEKRAPPDPNQTREWRDRTGQFRVEAAFLGFKNGVLRLHKVNGVIIEVPSEKMSVEDIQYVEKMTGRGSSNSRNADDDDDEPLANRRKSQQPATVTQKKAPTIDWFEFFLNAGCDVDDCTRYASSFERDKIDESILPDISEGTLRTLGLREGDIIRVNKAIDARRPKPPARPASTDVNVLGDEAPSPARTTPSPGPPNLFTGPGGQLKNARRGRPTPSKSGSTTPGAVDLSAISTASEQIARSSTPLTSTPTTAPTTAPAITNTTTTTSPVQVPSRSNSAAASGFDDDAWTNRPSSTKPVAPTPPILERVPSVPPLPGGLPITPVAPTPAQPPRAPSAPPTQTASGTGGGLAKTTDSDIFDQLARLSQLRVQNPAPAAAPKPAPAPSPSAPSPLPVGYNQGLGLGSSPSPLGQHLQAQQTGLLPPPAQVGPRGPFAPVPANQALLAPLVPTTTGFNGFVPTRPATSPSVLGPQPTGFQPSPLPPQPTGFQPSLASQPTGFQPSLAPQPTGFQPSFAPQPTGFQPSFAPQPTGFQPSLAPQPTGYGAGSPFGGGVPPVPPHPGSFQNGSFGQLQPQPTGFNPGFGQSPFGTPPPIPPLPQSIGAGPGPAPKDTNPVNVFAAMKAGTFANDSAPQSADKYEALRVTPSPLSTHSTGWGFPGFPGGYTGFQR